MTDMDARSLADLLELVPHPEGGFYRETYRGALSVPAHGGERAVSTAIYFLLTGGNFSAFHRIRSDELWHYYGGDPVCVRLLHADGRLEERLVGMDIAAGQRPQVVVPANCWFAASVVKPDGWTLVGCTVAPGFDFSDFELADRTVLSNQFPGHDDVIRQFTRV